MEKIEDLLEKIKRGEVNITKLSKDTGIPATRMYKWKDRDSDISLSDAKKLAAWANIDLDKSLNFSEESKDKTISDLAYSTRRLTDNNTNLVEMHRELLNKYVFNSGEPSSTSSSSKMKGKVSTDPTEEMQPGKQETSSEEKRKRKDSVEH